MKSSIYRGNLDRNLTASGEALQLDIGLLLNASNPFCLQARRDAFELTANDGRPSPTGLSIVTIEKI